VRSVEALLLAAGLLASTTFACADIKAQSGFDLVPLPGGRFVMGDPEGDPDEAPTEVEVAPFRMMRHEVTNGQFAGFVTSIGYCGSAPIAGIALRPRLVLQLDPLSEHRGTIGYGSAERDHASIPVPNWPDPATKIGFTSGPRAMVAGL
jgi:formylglycine-generating enzyme required for sulfatase activity